jgi:hypothetical protein
MTVEVRGIVASVDTSIAGLRGAAERAAEIVDVESAADALQHYFVTLSAISHNPLLAALCRSIGSITQIQIGLVDIKTAFAHFAPPKSLDKSL